MDIFSPWHLLILLVIVLALFGTKKLRNIGPDLGHAMREFKKALHDDDKQASADGEETLKADPPPAQARESAEQPAARDSTTSK